MLPSSNQRSESRLTEPLRVASSAGSEAVCSAMLTRHRLTTPLGDIRSLAREVSMRRLPMAGCTAVTVEEEEVETHGDLDLEARCSSGSGSRWLARSGKMISASGDWGHSWGRLGEGVREGRGVMRWRTALRRLIVRYGRRRSALGVREQCGVALASAVASHRLAKTPTAS